MKYLSVAIISLCLIAYASNAKKVLGTDLNEKVLELTFQNKEAPDRSLVELEKESGVLNKFVGSYPPRFRDENQRNEVYEHWLTLISDAEAHSPASSDKEKRYYILAELYRQGHNMDVGGSAERANENLEHCLSSFPNSVSCNLSATYFYLSVGSHLGQVEKSLNILREHYHPKLYSEVEGGYVFLYLYQRDVANSEKLEY